MAIHVRQRSSWEHGGRYQMMSWLFWPALRWFPPQTTSLTTGYWMILKTSKHIQVWDVHLRCQPRKKKKTGWIIRGSLRDDIKWYQPIKQPVKMWRNIRGDMWKHDMSSSPGWWPCCFADSSVLNEGCSILCSWAAPPHSSSNCLALATEDLDAEGRVLLYKL